MAKKRSGYVIGDGLFGGMQPNLTGKKPKERIVTGTFNANERRQQKSASEESDDEVPGSLVHRELRRLKLR